MLTNLKLLHAIAKEEDYFYINRHEYIKRYI